MSTTHQQAPSNSSPLETLHAGVSQLAAPAESLDTVETSAELVRVAYMNLITTRHDNCRVIVVLVMRLAIAEYICIWRHVWAVQVRANGSTLVHV